MMMIMLFAGREIEAVLLVAAAAVVGRRRRGRVGIEKSKWMAWGANKEMKMRRRR